MTVSTPSDATLAPALRGCFDSLAQCRNLLERLGPAQYAEPFGDHSAVGAHMRHVVEHFLIFLGAVETDGVVDYDGRERDPRIESSTTFCLQIVSDIERRLEALNQRALHASIQVCQIPAAGAAPIVVQSTLERELIFLSSHTIHHIALMVLVAELKGAPKSTEKDTGVAFSTQDYREKKD
mgnify:CR=1 FL=1